MKNLINYITRMDMEYKANTRLDMLTRDGSSGHVHMINYFTKYRNEIFHYAIIKSDGKPNSIEELTISHLHSYLGMRGYIKGIGAMSAEERTAAGQKGYENGLGAMSAEARTAVGERDTRMGSGLCRPRRGRQQVKRDMRMESGLCRPRQGRRQEKNYPPPMPKWASCGRRSTRSSKDAWKCQRLEPRYIIGNRIS